MEGVLPRTMGDREGGQRPLQLACAPDLEDLYLGCFPATIFWSLSFSSSSLWYVEPPYYLQSANVAINDG